MPTIPLKQRLIAEFLGTFGLLLAVFVVIGARARALFGPIGTDFGRYAALGLALFSMLSIFGSVSCHFNPAVSLGYAISRRLSWSDMWAYFAVQTMASLAAAIAATVLVGGPTRRVLPNASRVSNPRAFLFEGLATVVLVGTYVATETGLRALRPLLVGAAGGFSAIIIGRYTTLGMNPARSLGPALFDRFGSTTWIFLTAPLIGGAAAGLSARYSRSVHSSLIATGLGEFVGTVASLFLGLAGIRTVGGIVGLALLYAAPPITLFLAALLVRSRTYFNPAITLALFVGKRKTAKEAGVLIAAQLLGAVVAVAALRAWLLGTTREILQVAPVDRISSSRLFVFEAMASAVIMLVAIRRNNPIGGPAVVALTTLAMTATFSGFSGSTANLAWSVATGTGWDFTTKPSYLVWLISAPITSALIIGVLLRFWKNTNNTVVMT